MEGGRQSRPQRESGSPAHLAGKSEGPAPAERPAARSAGEGSTSAPPCDHRRGWGVPLPNVSADGWSRDPSRRPTETARQKADRKEQECLCPPHPRRESGFLPQAARPSGRRTLPCRPLRPGDPRIWQVACLVFAEPRDHDTQGGAFSVAIQSTLRAQDPHQGHDSCHFPPLHSTPPEMPVLTHRTGSTTR